jgi:hypothetical protein
VHSRRPCLTKRRWAGKTLRSKGDDTLGSPCPPCHSGAILRRVHYRHRHRESRESGENADRLFGVLPRSRARFRLSAVQRTPLIFREYPNHEHQRPLARHRRGPPQTDRPRPHLDRRLDSKAPHPLESSKRRGPPVCQNKAGHLPLNRQDDAGPPSIRTRLDTSPLNRQNDARSPSVRTRRDTSPLNRQNDAGHPPCGAVSRSAALNHQSTPQQERLNAEMLRTLRNAENMCRATD